MEIVVAASLRSNLTAVPLHLEHYDQNERTLVVRLLLISPRWPSPAMTMRGMHSSEQFRLFRERGCDLQAVVPVPYGRTASGGVWGEKRRMPIVEHDHGVQILHPRYVSMGPLANRGLGPSLQRELFWQALRPSVGRFVRGGGIVHVHSCALPGVVAGRIGSARLVATMHDHELATTLPRRPAWRKPILDTLRRADHVVYVSETLRRKGYDAIGKHASSVIPLAIDDHPDIAPAPAGPFTIVTVARLVPGKNIDLLIRAFARIHGSIEGTRLVVVGDGPERGALEALRTRLNLAQAVELVGHATNRQVREHMARAHVFALPSAPESLGTVYLEAMSIGVPIVGVAGQGISDFVTDTVDGFLIQRGDLEGFTRLLLSLYTDPLRRAEVGRRGRELFERSGFRWHDYVDRHLQVYKSLIG
jgi:glycosyltransferase involved in cell wall biosynthesis